VKSSSGSSEPSEPSVGRFEVDRSRLARQSLNVENWEEDSKPLEDMREREPVVTVLTDNHFALYSGYGRCNVVAERPLVIHRIRSTCGAERMQCSPSDSSASHQRTTIS
jgi:hypothetical protein